MNFTSKSLQSIFIILVSIQIAYSQDSSFVVGVWTTMGPDKSWNYPDPPDSAQVKALGVDLVLHTAIPEYSNYLNNFDKVIAVNAYEETDYIHTYSGAYYSRWECEEDQTITNIPGIKHDAGTSFGSAWSCDTTNSEIGDLVITGPDYDQDKCYRFYFNSDPIDYKVKFRVKIGQSTQDHDSVCVISVRYVTSDSRDTVLAYKTIYSDSLSTSYQDFTLEYSIPDTIDSKSTPLPSVSPEAIGLTSEIGVEKSANAHGVQFNVMYLGKHALYFDYIEVYDDRYGKDIVTNPPLVKTRIENYASTYHRSNLEYWYSLDEPKTIDNYEPYRIVDSILNAVSNTRLITAFYPGWNGKRNNENATGDFVSRAEPYKTMPYYYPYWPGADKYNHDGLYGQKTVLQAPYLSNGYEVGDYWFLAQAMGFWGVDSNDNLVPVRRRVRPTEMNASVMLALALGAKGIIFWHYYSYYNSNNRYRCYGIVKARDSLYAKTDLYYKIKDDIAPRLTGTLGNKLKTLKYEGDYAHERYGLGSEITDDYLPYLDISSTAADSANFHAGIYTVRFDATTVSRPISSGTYIYRMKAGKFVESKKMIVLK